MATISEAIEEFLKSILKDADGLIEIQRNELANKFNCVPSQINYVIDTRFTVEQGYYVESRRGGGGHIRIKAVTMDSSSFIMHLVTSIGDVLSQQFAEAFIVNLLDYDIISVRESAIFKAAISDKALGSALTQKDRIRAQVLKNMLISLM
ncbi:MAG: CtsR family transcriptional regulator [Ignavibacteriales bacterium]